jgi:hypothetical protein
MATADPAKIDIEEPFRQVFTHIVGTVPAWRDRDRRGGEAGRFLPGLACPNACTLASMLAGRAARAEAPASRLTSHNRLARSTEAARPPPALPPVDVLASRSLLRRMLTYRRFAPAAWQAPGSLVTPRDPSAMASCGMVTLDSLIAAPVQCGPKLYSRSPPR